MRLPSKSIQDVTEQQSEIELLERERVVLTGFAQKLLDAGWTLTLALQHLEERSIPGEKLKLIRVEDLRIPKVIDVGRDK